MRLLQNSRGQSMVELALITPLVLVALYVPFDFGMTIFTGHLTQIAVRDGARIASSTDLMDNTIAGNLATQFYANLPQMLVTGSPATKQVTVTLYGGSNCAQNVEVVAQGTYNFFFYRFIGLLGFTAPSPVKITRTTKMRYEFQPDANGGTGSTVTFCTTSTASGVSAP
jgi:Flp pilus assembly protein TadG